MDKPIDSKFKQQKPQEYNVESKLNSLIYIFLIYYFIK